MNRFLRIREEIKTLHASRNFNPGQLGNLEQQAFSFACYSIDFLRAAGLADRGFDLFLPRVLLLGHAVECMLKSCILLAGEQPRNSHDLLHLCESACTVDFELTDTQIRYIAQLQHTYFQDFLTKAKFKCRYPTGNSEAISGSLPSTASFAEILDSLRQQLANRSTEENKMLFSTVCNRPILDE